MMISYLRKHGHWYGLIVCNLLAGSIYGAEIVDLPDPATAYATWPPQAGVSVRFPAASQIEWPPDRQFRELKMDADGNGGSLFTKGDCGNAVGAVGLKVQFTGGPQRRPAATPTVCYLGGEAPGRDSKQQLRLNSILFQRAGCESGVAGAHRLVLQADVEIAYQTHTGGMNQPRLQLSGGGIDTDVREVALNGHRLAFIGGVIDAPNHGGIISYGGLDFGNGSLEFHDAVFGKDFPDLIWGAGFSATPGPAQPPASGLVGGTMMYLRGAGTLRWHTLSQQCLAPQDPNAYGKTMGPLTRWDTTALKIEIGNNRYRPGRSDWEVWSDGTRLKIGSLTLGGSFAANVQLVDRSYSTAGAGNEQLLVGTLELANNGRLDCNGIAIRCDKLLLNGKPVPAGKHRASTFAPWITDPTGRAMITVGQSAIPPLVALAQAVISLPEPGRVSVGIFTPSGVLLRSLMFGDQCPKGDLRVAWDGLDDLGTAVPAGPYEWRALSRPGFRASLVATLGTSHPEGPVRCWGGNHRGPETVSQDRDGIYLGFPGSEFTGQIVALRPDGTRRWSITAQEDYAGAPEAIAADDAGRLAVLSYPHGSYLNLTVVDAANGSRLAVFPCALDPGPATWGWCGNVDVAARAGVAIVTYRIHNQVRWLSLDDGKEVAACALKGPGSLTIAPDGAAWIVATDGIFRCVRGEQPVRMWQNVTLAQPRAIAWDLSAGNVLVAESGSQQVVRISPTGTVLARYGRAGGRQDGSWKAGDFRSILDLSSDGTGGFVTVESGRHAINRSAHFDSRGTVLAEWFGGQRWGHGIALDPEDPNLATIEGGPGMLCLVRIDSKIRTWTMLESYTEPDTDRLFQPLTENGWKLRRNGGRLWYVLGTPNAGVSLYEIDRRQGRLVPRAAFGRMDLRQDKPTLWTDAIALRKPADAPSAYSWSDENGDGRMNADEVTFGGFHMSWGMNLDIASDWTITAADGNPDRAWFSIPNARRASPEAPPRWDLSAETRSTATYPKQFSQVDDFGPRASGMALCRDDTGNTYQLVGGNGNANEDRQGAFWPEFYGSAIRLVKWDAAGTAQWAVGRHIGGRGRFTCAYGLLGTAHGNAIVRDRYGIPTSVWSSDGLYAGNLMEEVRTDRSTPWVADYWNGHADSVIEYDQTFNGLWSYPDGTVYYAMQGRSATPLFKIEGWTDWRRLSGAIVLKKPAMSARGTGSGLQGAYFVQPGGSGKPVLTRTDARIWFEAEAGITGGMVPANWGALPPAPGLSADHFSVTWTGELEPRFTEDYALLIENDLESQVQVWVGDRLVIDDDGGSNRRVARLDREISCRRTGSPALPLMAGVRVPLRILYTHVSGNAGIHLMWESRTQERQHIPARFLYSSDVKSGK